MRAEMILAERADRHADGTVTIFKGGIARIQAPEFPLLFDASVVVFFRGDDGDGGSHELQVHRLDQDGKNLLPDLKAKFDMEIVDGFGVGNTIANLRALDIKTPGNYTFVADMDGARVSGLVVNFRKYEPSK